MPKGTDGGQRRTMETPCGWRRVGSVREVNKLFMLHKRHCDICKQLEYKETGFCNEAGINNGWNGISGNNLVSDYHSICYKDGERVDVMAVNVSSIEEATNILNDNVETIIEVAKAVKCKKSKK
jgi:hypothetical protein